MTNEELISCQNVKLGYGKHCVLHSLNFTISRGDFLAIVGSNGSGKTTLIRGLLGLLRPQEGLFSRRPELHLGYVPQIQTLDELFPLTVFDVVLMGRFGRTGAIAPISAEDRAQASAALAEVGLADVSHQIYRELSGGQKQRTLIARALVSEPDILVLDEHTNDLDIAGEHSIMELITNLHTNHQLAIVMVSHSLNTVANHANTIGLIKDAQCLISSAETVMQSDYLQQIYDIPVQVHDVDGRKVVLA